MKKKDIILLVLVGVIVIGTAIILSLQKKEETETTKQLWVERPETGELKQELTLTMGELEKNVILTVEQRKKTEEEIEAAFAESLRMLEQMLNPEQTEKIILTKSFSLPEELPETGVEIRWTSSNEEVLRRDGTLRRGELSEPCEVTLQARLYYEGEVREYWFEAEVPPYEPGSSDAMFLLAEKALLSLEEETLGEDGFFLPEAVGQVQIGAKEEKFPVWTVMVVLVALIPFCVILAKRQEKEKERKRREAELLEGYPGLVTKFTLYTGAGMSLRGAWERIASQMREQETTGLKKSALCEEVFLLAGELKNGTSEARAYEAFGWRTGLKPYQRFAALLVNCLQKGSSGLRDSLGEEVRLAWEAHKETIAKKGEEAQTKMLFPMMGMLFLVMAIVMIPAFFSM